MKPGRLAGVAAVAVGTVGFVLAAVGGLATVLGLAGLCSLAVGCVTGQRSAVTVGCGGLFSGVVAAGTTGVDPVSLVGASVAVLVAWTVGQTATELRTFEPEARTRGLELTHVAGTTVVAAGAAGLALAPRALAVDPSPLGATLLLCGAVLLTASLRRSTRIDGS